MTLKCICYPMNGINKKNDKDYVCISSYVSRDREFDSEAISEHPNLTPYL